MGFVALTRMIVSAYTSSLSLSSSAAAQAGGGSAIKEGAIKIDRSVTIGVVGRSSERSTLPTLVREREESGWILSFLFPSFCVSVVPPPMLRRRRKTVLFRKAGCYLRGDVLGQLETGGRWISRRPRFRYLYLSLSPSCPESGHLEASDRVQLSFFGTDLASDTPKPRHRDAGHRHWTKLWLLVERIRTSTR